MYRSTLFLVASAALVFGGCAGRGSGDIITGTGGSGSGSGSGSGGSGSGSGSGGSGSGSGGDSSSSGGSGSSSGSGGSDSTGSGGANVTDGGVVIPSSTLAAADPCTGGGTPGPRKLWRLTAPEFAASIHTIFGDTANAAPVATVFSDPAVLGFSVDANALLVQDLNASQLEDNAEAIAAWAASAGKLSQFASCTTMSGAPAASCATSFIQAFGKAAFRTTLASSDPRISSYSSLFMAGSSNSDGAQAVISAMLQSPYFLYRSELGKQSGNTFSLTSYEVASELAYTLTGTSPDSTLLSAADSVNSGSLSMSSMIDQQAMRLVASSAASNSTAVMGFMNGWLGLPRLFTTAHDATIYQISATVQNEMQTESQDLIMEAFNGTGTFGSVLTADHSFLNADLASFYGISGVTGTTFKSVKYGGAITRDPGLLATGTILNGYARPDEDSPTQRGHMIRSRMLCQAIDPPPPNLNTTFMPSTAVETTRDHFINEHEQGQCKDCHKKMDWIGFAFENYDGWGRYRTTDNGLPTDDSATIYTDPEGNDDNVTGLSGSGSLPAFLAGSDDVTHCMERYWTYYVYGSSSWAQDGCTYDSVYNESQTNGLGLKSVLMAIIHAPNFTTRVQDQ
jgi:Protein of unknown function (DUF1592)/Protein of unknown function (DUF1588)/Protein of unknown function (DUF1595)/Protein of unknown function (DUF1587)